MRIFFATDIHGSDMCWRKFLNAGKFHKADVLIMGGDMTGKAMVPIVADGSSWELIRHFALAAPDDPQIGFLAQSPTGDGCGVAFRELAFSRERLRDLRSGA